MKKSIFVIIMTLTLGAIIFAAAPTNAVIDGAYETWSDTVISSVASFDTLVAQDSVTLFTRALTGVDRGWQYILVRDAISGDGSDSTYLYVYIDAMDGAGNVFYRTKVDSFVAAAGQAVLLPIGGTIFGDKYRCKLIGHATDNGGEVVINRLTLFKRRVATKPIPSGR